ncbi:MAG: hypothetical protein ABFS03_08205 [Chloroflexota bacterium]
MMESSFPQFFGVFQQLEYSPFPEAHIAILHQETDTISPNLTQGCVQIPCEHYVLVALTPSGAAFYIDPYQEEEVQFRGDCEKRIRFALRQQGPLFTLSGVNKILLKRGFDSLFYVSLFLLCLLKFWSHTPPSRQLQLILGQFRGVLGTLGFSGQERRVNLRRGLMDSKTWQWQLFQQAFKMTEQLRQHRHDCSRATHLSQAQHWPKSLCLK